MKGNYFALWRCCYSSCTSNIWAFWGIISKRLDQDPLYYSIVVMAGVAALILLFYAIVALVRDFKNQQISYSKPSSLYR